MSAPETATTLDAAVDAVLTALLPKTNEADVPAAVLLIDGRSGSGKSTLGAAVVRRWVLGAPAQLVRLDDIYPGWDGLEAAGRHLVEHVLWPRSVGREASWQRWDWASEQPAEWHDVDPARPLVVEGCGTLGAEARSLAALGVWVELDDAARKGRALRRDGELFAPHWERWAAQELAFAEWEAPRELADLEVDGRFSG